ncbi:MAG TPA: hypothetical protein VF691_11020 [Cytophagaceae bacterium]
MIFKSYFLIGFFLISLAASAQTELPLDSTTKKITYTEVVQVAGANKTDLYGRIKTSLKGCTAITDDKASASYKGKCSFKVTYPSPMKGFPHEGIINYVVNVGAKDGKYKYTITDIVHESNRGNGGKLENAIPECGKYTLILPGWASIKNSAKVQFPKIVDQLKSGMEGSSGKTAEPAQKDDW